MFRYAKKQICFCILTGGLILLFLTWYGARTAAAANSSEVQPVSAALCPEGQYIEMSSGFGGLIDVYDERGNRHCQFRDYMGGTPIHLYPGKLRSINYEDGIFINLETGEQLGPFPCDLYKTNISGDYLLAEDIEAQIIEIYDSNGTFLTSLPQTGEIVSWIIDGFLYILMQDQDSIRVQRYDSDTGAWSFVSGSCFSDGNIQEFSNISRFGNWYLIYGDSVNRVVTHDWEQIYIGEGYSFYNYSELKDYQYPSTEIGDAWYFLEYFMSGGMKYIRIYDSSLQIVLTMPADDWYSFIDCRGSYLTGIPCEELEGRICDGLMGRSENIIPYAMEGDMCIFPMKGGLSSVPVPSGETPEDINSRYLLTRDEEYRLHLYDISSGTEISFPDELNTLFIYLGTTGYAFYGFREADNEYESYLYDEDGQIIAHARDHSMICPWYSGSWYFRNGLSDGIIDESGKWLLRRWLQRD